MYTFRRSTTANVPSCVARKPKWIFHKYWRSFTTTWDLTSFAWASGSNGMASTDSSWRWYIQDNIDFNSCATTTAIYADQRLPGSCQFENTRGSSIGHEMDSGPAWKVRNLALTTMTGPAVRSFRKNMTAGVQYALNKCQSLGSGKQLILHGNPSAIARDSTFAECAAWVLYDSPGHSRRQFWHLRCQRWIHCLGTPLENPFKTKWRDGSVLQPNTVS